MSLFERYLNAERALNEGLIRLNRSLEQDRYPLSDPHKKMATMRAFLKELGEPQRGIPTLHIAGTSGKGSTAAAAAGALIAAGFRVGLHVSPYLQVAVEKNWINTKLVGADDFADAVDFVMPVARRYLRPDTPGSVHGMASVAVSLELFRRAKVDVMVFEAGCGGRFDLSSVVETRVAAITNVGLDHVRTLGPGIEQIAWHKAGIARPGAPLITGASGVALDVIREEADRTGALLEIVEQDEDVFSHNKKIAALAARRTAELLGRDIGETPTGLSTISLPGRSERMPGSPTVILDGAHNPDKLAAAVKAALSQAGAGPKICVFGLLGAKAGAALADAFAGRFDRIIVTEPSVYGKSSSPAENTAEMLASVGCPMEIIKDPHQALSRAVGKAGLSGTVFVTGSFYLAGNLRDRFYPREQVVLQRTSRPALL